MPVSVPSCSAETAGRGTRAIALVAGVGHGDAVRGFGAHGRGGHQDFLQQGLGHRAALQAGVLPLDPRRPPPASGGPLRDRAGGPGPPPGGGRRSPPGPRPSGPAPGPPGRAGGGPARRAASLRSRSTAISCVTPWRRSRRPRASRPASASTASSQSDRTVSRTSLEACGERPELRTGEREYTDEPSVTRCGPRRPVRSAAVFRRELRAGVRGQAGARLVLRARDQAAGGDRTQARRSRSEPRKVQHHVRAPARGAQVIMRRWRSTTARSPARSPDTCRTTCSVIVANATNSCTAKREAVPGAGHDQVLRDVAQLRLAGRQRDDPGLHEEVVRKAPSRRRPGARRGRSGPAHRPEVAARVAQVGGHHPAHGAIQFALATEQPQAQRVGVQQCAQPHSRRRRSLSRNLRWGRGPVERGAASAASGAVSQVTWAVPHVSAAKRRGYRGPPFIRIYKMRAPTSQLLHGFRD